MGDAVRDFQDDRVFPPRSTQNRRFWVRLREKGGKRHAMPCHHNLEEYLTAYLDGAGLRDDPTLTTRLYHRRRDEVSLDEVERIVI